LEYDTKLNLDITHHPPLLIHEYYRVDVVLENPMKDAVTDASALFTPGKTVGENIHLTFCSGRLCFYDGKWETRALFQIRL
jgi:hypothetical protein